MNSNYTVQQFASDSNLWETYVDPDNNAPFGDMSQFEREQMIREIWPDTPDKKNPHAAALGALGGQASTDAKANAARENGKRGGRPRKTE